MLRTKVPWRRAWRICMRSERPGARAESLRFTEENTVSIRARRPGKFVPTLTLTQSRYGVLQRTMDLRGWSP